MKKKYLPFLLFLLLSCSYPKAPQGLQVYEDNNVAKGQDVSLLDSVKFYQMIDKSGIFSAILDSTVELANNKQIDSDLLDYDCFVLCIQHRTEFNDTICSVGPSKLKYLVLEDDSITGYHGFWKWNQYPVFIHGNVAKYYLKKLITEYLSFQACPFLMEKYLGLALG